MSPIFEIKIISVSWIDKDIVGTIDVSEIPIEIEENDTNIFSAESYTYPEAKEGIGGQLAIRLIDNSSIIPYINNHQIKLFRINDIKTNNDWWIEKGAWQKTYHDAPSCRHAGKMDIIIGNQTLKINILPSGLSYNEYFTLIDDFKNDLWQLILNPQNYIGIEKDSSIKIYNEEFENIVLDFIKNIKGIIENPKVELREVQSLQPYNKVRPVARTFMEIASKGESKQLTGRTFKSNYNLRENSYMLTLVEKTILILKNSIIGIERMKNSFLSNIKEFETRKNGIKDYIEINPKEFRKSLDFEKEKQKKFESDVTNYLFFDSKINEYKEFVFEITSKPKYDKNDKKIMFEANIDKYFFKFNVLYSTFGKDLKSLKKNKKYKFSGQFSSEPILDMEKTRDGKINTLKSVIEIIYQVEKLEKLGEDLERKNWRKEYENFEKEEQKKERESLDNQINRYNQIIDQFKNINFDNLLIELYKVKKKLLKLGIYPYYEFPGSITFIQNPFYRGALSCYRKIIEKTGISDDIFKDIISIERFGILDIPIVYERWCLLQIIDVFLNVYHFEGEEGWFEKLVKTINSSNSKNKTYKITMANKDLELKIDLYYQYNMIVKQNKPRTPDFKIELYDTNNREIIGNIILDSKFKDFDSNKNHAKISEELNELINIKDYSQGGKSAVFIIHPSLNAIESSYTLQEWKNNSYYGGEMIFEWQSISPKHNMGAVLLRPHYKKDLHRLIGLILQYLPISTSDSISNNSNNSTDSNFLDNDYITF